MFAVAASGIRSTLSSLFNYQSPVAGRKRPATEMIKETPENLDPNVPPPCPRKRSLSRRSPLLIDDKVRRRLFSKEKKGERIVAFISRPSSSDGMGPLATLPNELLHQVLSLLDRNTLVQLAFASKDLNQCVTSYILGTPGLKHILHYNQGKFDSSYYSEAGIISPIYCDVYYAPFILIIGTLLRKITATKNMRQSLRIASKISYKVQYI